MKRAEVVSGKRFINATGARTNVACAHARCSTRRHRFIIQFCFPRRAKSRILAACLRWARGATYWRAQGVWRAPTGEVIDEPVLIGLVGTETVSDTGALCEDVLTALSAVGEQAGWLVVQCVFGGGEHPLGGAQTIASHRAETPPLDAAAAGRKGRAA